MKFYVEPSKKHDDEVVVNVIQSVGNDEMIIGSVECKLDFREGLLVLDIKSSRSEVLPLLQFNYDHVAGFDRHSVA